MPFCRPKCGLGECLCIFGKSSQLKWTCCSEIFSNICRPSGCLLSEPLLHSWAAPSTWIKKRKPSPVVAPGLCSPYPSSNCTVGICTWHRSMGHQTLCSREKNDRHLSQTNTCSLLWLYISYCVAFLHLGTLKLIGLKIPGPIWAQVNMHYVNNRSQVVFMTAAAHCYRSCKTEFEVSMTTEGTMLPLFPVLCWVPPHNSIS